MDKSEQKTTPVGDELRRRARVKGKPLSVICVSLLSNLIGLISCCIAFMAITCVLLYNNYHHGQCALHEPGSQFFIGEILITQACPYPMDILEDMLVESYADEVPDA